MDTFDFGDLFAESEPAQPPVTAPPVKIYRHTAETLRLVNRFDLPVKEAYQLVTGKEPSPPTVSRLKELAGNYSLTTPEMQKLAHQTVSKVLQGKPMKQQLTTVDRKTGQVIEYTANAYPTHTNQLAAASMVADRVEPIVRQNVNLNGNLKDFLPFKVDELG